MSPAPHLPEHDLSRVKNTIATLKHDSSSPNRPMKGHTYASVISQEIFNFLISQYRKTRRIDDDTVEQVKRMFKRGEGLEEKPCPEWEGRVPEGLRILALSRREREGYWSEYSYPLPDTLRIIYLISLMGSQKLILYLLDKHDDITVRGPNGTTLLHTAADWGHTETVEKLFGILNKSLQPIESDFLDARSRIFSLNRTDSHGATALEVAAWRGHRQVVQQLLDHGADLGIAVHMALDGGFPEIACLLLGREGVGMCDNLDEFGNTMLHALAQIQHYLPSRNGEFDYEARKDEHLRAATSVLAAIDPSRASRPNKYQETAWDIAHEPVFGVGDQGLRNYIIASMAMAEVDSAKDEKYIDELDDMQTDVYRFRFVNWHIEDRGLSWLWLTKTNVSDYSWSPCSTYPLEHSQTT